MSPQDKSLPLSLPTQLVNILHVPLNKAQIEYFVKTCYYMDKSSRNGHFWSIRHARLRRWPISRINLIASRIPVSVSERTLEWIDNRCLIIDADWSWKAGSQGWRSSAIYRRPELMNEFADLSVNRLQFGLNWGGWFSPKYRFSPFAIIHRLISSIHIGM